MLVKKSIRLPAELVEYIEQQPGRSFSDKLVSLLDELASGHQERMKLIRSHEQALQELRKSVDGYYDLIYRTRQASRQYEQLLRQLQKDIDNLNQDSS